jgi:hypothetical protein
VLECWEGPTHDASILADNLPRPDEMQIPDGKFYLGDVGCVFHPGILPPFRKTRYHLNKVSPRNRSWNADELFNLGHSRFRVSIKRAFVALKTVLKSLTRNHYTLPHSS